MNYMSLVLGERKVPDNNKNLANKIDELKVLVKKNKIKFNKTIKKLGNTMYSVNGLPYISVSRDVLKKPDSICSIRVNWKKKSMGDMTLDEAIKELKEQWCWNVSVVDEEHTRNKYKNKDIICVVFDTKEEAEKNMEIFNKLFMTAIEQDCVEEYKRFKENPDKRPLTFDRLVSNYAELYQAVDDGIL